MFGDPNGNLPWASAEAKAVAATLGVAPVLYGNVTVAAVRAALRTAGTVHLTCHARACADDGRTAGAALADGVLSAGDPLLERIGADLVVLSGCETG